MDDDFDDINNISELKILESLNLGTRKKKSEESKKEENDKFINDINLLLSKMNEQIIAIKKRPKLEIQSFDIDKIDNMDNINNNNNIDSNNMNNENNNKKSGYIVNPYSKKPSSNNMNNFNTTKNNMNSGLNSSNII